MMIVALANDDRFVDSSWFCGTGSAAHTVVASAKGVKSAIQIFIVGSSKTTNRIAGATKSRSMKWREFPLKI